MRAAGNRLRSTQNMTTRMNRRKRKIVDTSPPPEPMAKKSGYSNKPVKKSAEDHKCGTHNEHIAIKSEDNTSPVKKSSEDENAISNNKHATAESGENESAIKNESEENNSITNNDGIIPSGSIVPNSSSSSRRNRRNPQQQWDEKLKELKEFKAKHGHVNVPKNETYKQLGRFVNNQRQFYRKRMNNEKNSLTVERINALEDLGFVWSMKPISENRARSLQAQWEQRLQELQEYKKMHGHCNVSIKGKDRELGKFVMNQRYYYKTRLEGQKNSLTPERIQDLESIDFVWTLKGKREDGDDGKFLSNEEKWERNIQELKRFKQKFGHVNVTKSGEYMELGQFVGNQRYFYRRRLKGENTSLTDDRVRTLSGLGFDWKARNKGGASKFDISLKMKGDAQELEKDKEITLPDGSTIGYATKESSQKRLVLLEDGSHLLETTTRSYTTKIEKSVVPHNDVEDIDAQPDTKVPALPSGLNVTQSENEVTYPDGSSVVCKTEESSKKRLTALEDGTQLLETTTTTCITKIDQARLPEEESKITETQSDAEPLLAEV